MSQPNSTSPRKSLTLDDLEAIAKYLGGYLEISIVPKELARPWWWEAEQWINSKPEATK
jgi:hypothetical protein